MNTSLTEETLIGRLENRRGLHSVCHLCYLALMLVDGTNDGAFGSLGREEDYLNSSSPTESSLSLRLQGM